MIVVSFILWSKDGCYSVFLLKEEIEAKKSDSIFLGVKLQKHEDDLKPKDKKAQSRAEVVITSGTPDKGILIIMHMALNFILLLFLSSSQVSLISFISSLIYSLSVKSEYWEKRLKA